MQKDSLCMCLHAHTLDVTIHPCINTVTDPYVNHSVCLCRYVCMLCTLASPTCPTICAELWKPQKPLNQETIQLVVIPQIGLGSRTNKPFHHKTISPINHFNTQLSYHRPCNALMVKLLCGELFIAEGVSEGTKSNCCAVSCLLLKWFPKGSEIKGIEGTVSCWGCC